MKKTRLSIDNRVFFIWFAKDYFTLQLMASDQPP